MSTSRLSASDWTRAALDALTRGGVEAVRVDALARRLRITRGSFYWHFKDRDALLTAALEEWERICTTEVIEMLDAVDRPDERLRMLFRHAFEVDEFEGLEPAILAQADHPVVAPILRRVTRTRLDFLTGAFQEIGLAAGAARRQAVAVYAAYVGWLDLRRAAPDVVPEVAKSGRKSGAALDHLLEQFGLRV
jgi:AcrR family transcriptional regulator